MAEVQPCLVAVDGGVEGRRGCSDRRIAALLIFSDYARIECIDRISDLRPEGSAYYPGRKLRRSFENRHTWFDTDRSCEGVQG